MPKEANKPSGLAVSRFFHARCSAALNELRTSHD